MLSLAKARKDYYLQKAGEITPREDYYLRGGYAAGHWHGKGAAEMGLDGTLTAEGLVRLFDGEHPITGEQLGRRLRKDGVAAWDLTFSADKSVSLMWAFGDKHVRRHVMEAFHEATTEAVAYLESVASSTRGASRTPMLDDNGDPVLDLDGTPKSSVETWPIRTTGYVSARFTEFTSRADDPQLHTHVVVGNRVKGVDGVWRAIDGRLLYRHKLATGYLHEAELRSRLTERLGVRWQPVRNGVADIEGFTRSQIMAFSRRRQEIEAWRKAHGLEDTAAANEVATLATRTPKQDHPLDSLMPGWLDRAAEVGLIPETIAAVLSSDQSVTRPDHTSMFERLAGEEGLTAHASTFARADVLADLAGELPEGGSRGDIERLADRFLHHPDVIPILPTQTVPIRRENFPVELTPSELERLAELTMSMGAGEPMRRGDGHMFPGLIHERRYTTAQLLAVEQRMIQRHVDGVAAGRWAVPESDVEKALSNDTSLTEGQEAMVRQFATSGSTIDLGVGAAGTGKTTVMAIVGKLADGSGTPIFGTALAARAAAGFEEATDIPSTTITRLLWQAKEEGGLASGAILIVDEAGMVGSRKLAAVSDLVEEASGKLILIGDHRQLTEIDAGGLFAALCRRGPAVELTENVRQHERWERTALTELRHGSVSRAVAIYKNRGRIHVTPTLGETITQAVTNWYRDVQECGSPRDVLLIGHQNSTVDELNRRARSLIAQGGGIGGAAVTVEHRTFQAGDRVVCLKNRPQLGVLNGDLATITYVDTEATTITISLDRIPRSATIPDWYVTDGHLDWGYALTGHKAQGATTRRAHTVADGSVDREWTYVTMSRGQEANTMYLMDTTGDDESCDHLIHEHPEQMSALMASLAGSRAENAASETGRGPRVDTDAQLQRRHGALQAFLSDAVSPRCNIPAPIEQVAEYLHVCGEVQARHQDRLAVLAYQPPRWIVDDIGERPSDPHQRAAWDRIVDCAVRYRTDYGIPDSVAGLLGPHPSESPVDDRAAWIAAQRSIKRELLQTQRPGRDNDITLPLAL